MTALLQVLIHETYQALVDKITQDFDRIASLREQAFDLNSNLCLVESSIQLARLYNVEETKILKNEEDLHDFLFN